MLYKIVNFQFQIIPTSDGQLVVTVYDLCVATSQPAQVTVTVSGVGSVMLYVTDKVGYTRMNYTSNVWSNGCV